MKWTWILCFWCRQTDRVSDELKWKLLELDVVDSAEEIQNDDDKTNIDKKSVR